MNRSLLLLPIFMYVGSCALAADYTVETFYNASLELTAGMGESSVYSALGKPETIESADLNKVKVLKANKGLVYWHPEWATVHLLVGIKDSKISGLSMCKAIGSRVWSTKCDQPSTFWQEMK